VELDGDLYAMNFPARSAQPCAPPQPLVDGLGALPLEVLAADDYLAVFESESQVRSLAPDFSRLRELDLRGVIATAPGGEVDFVSRFFAPKYGIDEDPVTGSAHCELTPYWSRRLGKSTLSARQISRRGGDVDCEMAGDRVVLRAAAVTFMEAYIQLDDVR
jgi:predicted PhzF superfamily epimerase YddE/YHI9